MWTTRGHGHHGQRGRYAPWQHGQLCCGRTAVSPSESTPQPINRRKSLQWTTGGKWSDEPIRHHRHRDYDIPSETCRSTSTYESCYASHADINR